MLLTDWAPAIVLGIGAGALFLGLVVGSPQRSWGAAAGRAAQLVLFTAFVLGLVAWALNRTYGYLDTWDELRDYVGHAARQLWS